MRFALAIFELNFKLFTEERYQSTHFMCALSLKSQCVNCLGCVPTAGGIHAEVCVA